MTDLKIEHKFDIEKKRHYINNFQYVFHCHHYMSLFTQLAIDTNETFNGIKILYETSENLSYQFLINYFSKNNINDINEKIETSCKLYSFLGLGKMNVKNVTENGGEIELLTSHVDEGWLKKWGKSDKPVNHVTAGYISGMFSAIFNKPIKTYKINEIQSIVKGDKISIFKINL